MKTYSSNVYIFQPSKNFFITVEYDIKICLLWAGFFPGFLKVGLPKKNLPGCPNPAAGVCITAMAVRQVHLVITVVKLCSCYACRKYLETDLKFPDDVAHRYGDIVAKHVTHTADSFRRLIFVDDLVNTLKVVWRLLCLLDELVLCQHIPAMCGNIECFGHLLAKLGKVRDVAI